MPVGVLKIVGKRNSVIVPAGVMRPIWSLSDSVNHRLPSGPAVIPEGKLAAVGMRNSVIVPAGVMRPMRFASDSVNHRFPSGAAVMAVG